jgi:16S rRNA (cytosine1402-N4)-methyltransferase
MEFEHRPVLLEPTVDALLLPDFGGKGAARSHQQAGPAAATRAEGGVFVDGTFGRGGHSRELLGRLGPSARLVVFDKDPEAIAVARQLAAADPRVTVVHGGFATMAEELEQLGIGKVDGVMLDLGVSSPQIDDAERGFSFMRDGPLDMRMDTTRGPTVADWLAQASVDEMREVIADYGEDDCCSPRNKAAAHHARACRVRRQRRPHARKGATSGHTHLSSSTDLHQSGTRRARAHPRGSSRPARPGREVGGDQLSFA